MSFRKPTKYTVVDDVVFAWTSNGNLFLVSSQDVDLLEKSWTLSTTGYLVTGNARGSRKNQTIVLLHKIVGSRMGIKAPFIDHVNQCKVNNLRSNLRGATKSLNSMNSPKRKNNRSGYKNLYKLKHSPGWMVGVQKKKKYFGSSKLEEALSLRDKWVKEAFDREIAKVQSGQEQSSASVGKLTEQESVSGRSTQAEGRSTEGAAPPRAKDPSCS